jgi:hypothetical protein
MGLSACDGDITRAIQLNKTLVAAVTGQKNKILIEAGALFKCKAMSFTQALMTVEAIKRCGGAVEYYSFLSQRAEREKKISLRVGLWPSWLACFEMLSACCLLAARGQSSFAS